MGQHDYKKLLVWNSAVELAVTIYSISSDFPKKEVYGLISQMQRSSVSISSNIAEGAGRNSNKSFAQFLSIAYGSACELETQVIIASRLNYISNEKAEEIMSSIQSIQKMIYNLINKMKTVE
jgi:four helix bundle protein